MDQPGGFAKAAFAAGCFWDVEAAFRQVNGVIETIAGYTGGTVPDPTYEQVESGTTGHVEAVGIVFDPAVIPYERLLDRFWEIHDPTKDGGQGDYTGPQYRSVIFFFEEEQRSAAEKSRDQRIRAKRYGDRPVLTMILPASTFWPAEECHQHFYEKCGQGYNISRKIWD